MIISDKPNGLIVSETLMLNKIYKDILSCDYNFKFLRNQFSNKVNYKLQRKTNDHNGKTNNAVDSYC